MICMNIFQVPLSMFFRKVSRTVPMGSWEVQLSQAVFVELDQVTCLYPLKNSYLYSFTLWIFVLYTALFFLKNHTIHKAHFFPLCILW